MLERDAEELFDLTARGLAFYGEQFAMPFPQRRYDQVFVPEIGGAMENYGCVTWSDSFIYRDPPSYAEREYRALVLLHEMAHMWFGDIVTMRWWDDLWLNESFAEWACEWAGVACTEFTDMRAGFLATEKQDAYAADSAPTTHPIRQELVDVATAAASFDDITYPKGAAVLKQLVAFVGEDAFVAGAAELLPQARLGKHHARRPDRRDRLGQRPRPVRLGRGLAGDLGHRPAHPRTPGRRAHAGRDAAERAAGRCRTACGSGRTPTGATGSPLLDMLSVEVAGERTRIDDGAEADLLLVNDEDLTFATVRPDPASLELILTRGGELPTAIGRTLALTTAWRLMYDGELTAQQFVDCGVGVLATRPPTRSSSRC